MWWLDFSVNLAVDLCVTIVVIAILTCEAGKKFSDVNNIHLMLLLHYENISASILALCKGPLDLRKCFLFSFSVFTLYHDFKSLCRKKWEQKPLKKIYSVFPRQRFEKWKQSKNKSWKQKMFFQTTKAARCLFFPISYHPF